MVQIKDEYEYAMIMRMRNQILIRLLERTVSTDRLQSLKLEDRPHQSIRIDVESCQDNPGFFDSVEVPFMHVVSSHRLPLDDLT